MHLGIQIWPVFKWGVQMSRLLKFIFEFQVNNALSFVAAIGNKFSPQTSPASTSTPAQQTSTGAAQPPRSQQAPPTNLCGWTSYGQEGGNSFGVHPWHASITVGKGEDYKQVCKTIWTNLYRYIQLYQKRVIKKR